MTFDLQHALEELYGLERRRDKLGLEGTRALLGALGDPHRRFRAIHVAGTNGKGSVCALVERALRAAGLRTGLFTSPHLVDFRERIRIDGRMAGRSALAARLAAIQALPEGRDRTFFEVCTALGFDAFAAAGVDWAVVETGLGGRLDSTNVLASELAVITGIAVDHAEILGESRAAIAAEKAGIVKPGVPVVTGVRAGDAAAVVERVAAERGAPLRRAWEWVRVREVRCGPEGTRFQAEVAPWGTLDLEIRLRGRHQLENAGVALAALSALASGTLPLPASAVRLGFAEARWPGRLEPCPTQPRLWWDGAHNPEGLARVARAWTEDLGFEPPAAIVLATSRDKPAGAMLEALAAWTPRPLLVVTRTRNERAGDPEVLHGEAAAQGWRAVEEPGVAAAVERALARTGRGRVLLTGSLFAVGEAMAAFGGAPEETS